MAKDNQRKHNDAAIPESVLWPRHPDGNFVKVDGADAAQIVFGGHGYTIVFADGTVRRGKYGAPVETDLEEGLDAMLADLRSMDDSYIPMGNGQYVHDERHCALAERIEAFFLSNALAKECVIVELADSAVEGSPESIIRNCKLSCGHWTTTFSRFCPHCGSKIVSQFTSI